ncbi:Major Facilitator Superfamily protein [Micromonospora pallida]|uniref:Major Facilitator Superfamily protein n=1 Tax=Micromonospora pallida TaxID=145854 RepID=A0A1C6TI16_9ACTN|nr:MFS transporter [Micromonospora pallida]SCL41175.1 Major Facilitator Superfamily protein [Micromonospora pallida]
MHTVLRRPDFRLLFGALLASMTAESILVLALAIWVKDLTGSDRMAASVIFSVVAPRILAPLVGWVVDRYRRRPSFVAANVVTAALLTPLLTVRDSGDVWIVYLVGAFYGLSSIALGAALSGLLRTLLPLDLLAEANAAMQTVRQSLRLGGPLVGAALYAAVGGWALTVIGVTGFVTAAAVAGLLRVVEPTRPQRLARSLTELGAGLRHLGAEPLLRRALLGYGVAALVIGFSEALLFAYVEHGLGRPPAFVGVLFSVQGVGGLAGALLSPAVVRRFGEVGALAAGVGLFGTAALTLAYPGLWLAVAALLLAGLSLPLSWVGLHTLVQRRTEPGLIGRATAATDALVSGPQAISIGTGAVLVAVLDYRLLFALVGVVMLAAAAYLWRARRLAPAPAGSVPAGPVIPAPRRPLSGPRRARSATRVEHEVVVPTRQDG